MGKPRERKELEEQKIVGVKALELLFLGKKPGQFYCKNCDRTFCENK